MRTHAEELRGTIGELRERAEAAEQPLAASLEERRSLVAHLARVENELVERDERVDKLVSSRWYQLASATWRLRRRPVLLAIGLGPALLLVAAFAALALLDAPWPAFASLAAVTVIVLGLIGRRALRGLRRRPRRRRRSAAVALAEGQEIAPPPGAPAAPTRACLAVQARLAATQRRGNTPSARRWSCAGQAGRRRPQACTGTQR